MHRLEQSLPYLQPLGGREQMNNGHYQGCDQPCLSKEIAPLLLNNDLKCCLYLQLHDGLIKKPTPSSTQKLGCENCTLFCRPPISLNFIASSSICYFGHNSPPHSFSPGKEWFIGNIPFGYFETTIYLFPDFV